MKVYLIHDPKLTNRTPYYEGTISKLKELINEDLSVEYITEPYEISKDDVKNKMKLEKTNDPDFDKSLTYINTEQALNIEKHKSILKKIIQLKETCLVLEDDVVISMDYSENITNFFNQVENFDYDILFIGFSENDASSKDIKLIDSREKYKILISKASYLIKPHIAQKLLDYLEYYRYPMKTSLSKFIWDNKDIRSFITNKHMLLESSKIGIHPTSINYNNMLVFNPDYIKLVKLISNETFNSEMMKTINEIYNKLKKLESPDVHHIMSIIYHKQKLYDDAKEELMKAIDLSIKKNGYLGKNSELLNNAINIYQYNQDDVDEYCKLKSKYLTS
tara:strand:+ start:2542 stop:3543 length:1002 start_codon:yes stop_codon:yes gene_type:complete